MSEKLAPSLRLAFIGSNGLPADLPKGGGGERETEAKAVRLAQRAHVVTVYCRWHYNRHPATPYCGVNMISLPSVPTKSLDTLSHSLFSTLHVLFRNTADIVSYHGMGNAVLLPLIKLGRKKSVVYMDGVDWDRPKWGKLAKFILKLGAGMAYRMADVVYVDNRVSQRIFAQLFGCESLVITLAADLWEPPGNDLLQGFGLNSEQYILFVGVLRPDKGVHLLIEAYRGLSTTMPLVIIGDNPQEPKYVQHLKNMSDSRVRFLGYAYGQAARQLFANCYLYVQPSVIEGNSPALMSAMACGRCVVVNGIEQNLETIGDAGAAFAPNDVNSLRDTLATLIHDPARVRALGNQARQRIEQHYNWESVVDQLEHMYKKIASET